MRSKSVVLMALALGCGLVAAIGVSQVLDRNQAPPPSTEVEPVFVCAADINPNDLVTAQMLKLEEWPKGRVPPGAVTKLEEVEGKRCRQKLYAGEPVLLGKLRGQADDLLPSDGIPKGFRVVNVRVDSVSGTGLIVPGDRVDVLVFFQKNDSNGIDAATARTILQDIKVYAIDTAFVGKHESDSTLVNGKTVSLLVTPSQAEKIMLASELGSIRLIIRSLNDEEETSSNGATTREIFGGPEKNSAESELKPRDEVKALAPPDLTAPPVMPVVAQPPRPWKMTLVEGSAVRTVDFTPEVETPSPPDSPENSSGGAPPVAEPPVAEPPVAEPPVATPTGQSEVAPPAGENGAAPADNPAPANNPPSQPESGN